MFAGFEHIFSNIKIMISFYYNNLSDEVVKASESLRAWFFCKVGGDF